MPFSLPWLTDLRRSLWDARRLWLTAIALTACIAGGRSLMMLQTLELAAYDQMFRLRPVEPVDDRIVLVTIDDTDAEELQTWPIPDAILAQVIKQIAAAQPRAIGLDIYRELPVQPGHAELAQVFATTPNLIGIELLDDERQEGIKPPPILRDLGLVGFNNVVVDADNRVRRAVLYWGRDGEQKQSVALRLALAYLEPEGIQPESVPGRPNLLRLGDSVFYPFQPNHGSYVRADSRGYQILANLHSLDGSFTKVPVRQILAGTADLSLFRDRVVLIGSTAPSYKDYFYTAHSSGARGAAQPIFGVELQGLYVSQLLGAALDGRSPIRVLSDQAELALVLSWALIGASASWRMRQPLRTMFTVLTLGGGLVGGSFLAFLAGWWLPLVPCIVGLGSAAIAISIHIAYLRSELQKSKEFLASVINTIPDPIFVKDQSHRWIALNDAFSRFIGYPSDQLLEKNDFQLFPVEQATQFWQQDDLTFTTGAESEVEEEVTNASGATFQIATKRTLHRDAAGHLFLVGVMRDITQRKRLEAELVQSNAELRQMEHQLRQMAYHDSLTGLPNRDLFLSRLDQALQWASTRDQMVAVCFLDLDGFKAINDTYGHTMGNHLLHAVAQRLNQALRSSDLVARFGGDEFVVLLPGIHTSQDVVTVVGKILDGLVEPFCIESATIPVTTSIGIGLYPLDATDADGLLQKADAAMYAAKDMGKNGYAFAKQNAVPNHPAS